LQKAQTPFPTLPAACELAQAKALGNSRSFRSRRLSARNESSSFCGGALPGLPLHSLLLPRAFASAGQLPLQKRPQADAPKLKTDREENLREEKESNSSQSPSNVTLTLRVLGLSWAVILISTSQEPKTMKLKALSRARSEPWAALITLLALILSGCSGTRRNSADTFGAQEPQTSQVKIVHAYPHDPKAFTQGLVFHDGFLYESTGLWGESSIRKVDLETGKLLQFHSLDPRFFGEGLTVWQGKLIQLTWKEKTGFVYDLLSFRLIRDLSYSTEGWGLTHDGERLIMSDGTPTLHFLDPATFQEVRRLQVSDNNRPVQYLNELEYVKGELFANVWQSNRIARISPRSGQVLGWIDLTSLRNSMSPPPGEVLNGIAYDQSRDRLFVTGKYWPQLFQIEIAP